VPLAECPFGGLANDGECFRKQIVKRFALRQPIFENPRLAPQFFVAHGLEARFQRVDLLDPLEHGPKLPFVHGAKETLRNVGEAEHEIL
jgi:hypothetical protein